MTTTSRTNRRVHTGGIRFFPGRSGSWFPYGLVTFSENGRAYYSCMTYELDRGCFGIRSLA
jgi:hypothetical protein